MICEESARFQAMSTSPSRTSELVEKSLNIVYGNRMKGKLTKTPMTKVQIAERLKNLAAWEAFPSPRADPNGIEDAWATPSQTIASQHKGNISIIQVYLTSLKTLITRLQTL